MVKSIIRFEFTVTVSCSLCARQENWCAATQQQIEICLSCALDSRKLRLHTNRRIEFNFRSNYFLYTQFVFRSLVFLASPSIFISYALAVGQMKETLINFRCARITFAAWKSSWIVFPVLGGIILVKKLGCSYARRRDVLEMMSVSVPVCMWWCPCEADKYLRKMERSRSSVAVVCCCVSVRAGESESILALTMLARAGVLSHVVILRYQTPKSIQSAHFIHPQSIEKMCTFPNHNYLFISFRLWARLFTKGPKQQLNKNTNIIYQQKQLYI